MITSNDRNLDLDDLGLSNHALIRRLEETQHVTDVSIVAVGYGVLMSLIGKAAVAIAAQAVIEGDDWDGCFWIERLDDTSKGA
jgi:hypothetical protein